jgi:hypothetical protein
MRQLLGFVNQVHQAPGLPLIRSALDERIAPSHPPPIDPRANPRR